ncbi:MAG: SHD1 domain-containing protein, partial [Aureliella sp.]
ENFEASRQKQLISLEESAAKLRLSAAGDKENRSDLAPSLELAIKNYLDECRQAYPETVRKLRDTIEGLSVLAKEVDKGATFVPPTLKTEADVVRYTNPQGKVVWFFRNPAVKKRQLDLIDKRKRTLTKFRSQVKNSRDPNSILQLAMNVGPKLDARHDQSVGFLYGAIVLHAFNGHEVAVEYDGAVYMVWLESTTGLSTGEDLLPCPVFVEGTATVQVPGKSTTSVTVLRSVSESDIRSVLDLTEPTQPSQSGSSAEEGQSVVRTWTDKTGKFKVEAKLESFDGNSVKLKRRDGSVLDVPVASLSEADQQYLKKD